MFQSISDYDKIPLWWRKKTPVTHVLSSEIPLQIQPALHTCLYYHTVVFQCSKTRLCCESPTQPSLYGDTTNEAQNVRLLWPPHATNTRVWGKVGPLKQEWIRITKVIHLQSSQTAPVESVRQFCFLHLLKKKVWVKAVSPFWIFTFRSIWQQLLQRAAAARNRSTTEPAAKHTGTWLTRKANQAG